MTGAEETDLFGGHHPWVTSSPQARLPSTATSSVAESKAEEAMPIPPEPKLPAPPELDQDSVLTHLRGLKKAMKVLPESLESQLQELEQQAKDKVLSHGHLNRLTKLQKQLTGLANRIKEMDVNWKAFSEQVLQRYADHQEMYRTSRAELLQEFMKKNQEVQVAKTEVQQASLTLLEKPAVETPTEEAVDVTEVITEAVKEDAYMMQDADMEEVEATRERVKRDALAPFRTTRKPTSPTKVHSAHLKAKESKK